MSETNEVLDEIWDGDLFRRREEADQLLAYIEGVVGRENIREDKKAFTIAVDAPYGEGKSFFLRRFARQAGRKHPVALIDAWADDLADEPLVALAATLRDAFTEYSDNNEVSSKVQAVLGKTGKVAKIVGRGLARRGLGLAIGTAAVGELEGLTEGLSEEGAKAIQNEVRDTAKSVVDDASDEVGKIRPLTLMKERLKEFDEGKAAVQELKDSLVELVSSLSETDRAAPIIIVIDELDRCRPTYSIKLLEEIKHLFDVPGIVFVLATHRKQLGFSISGAYGSNFDGHSYIRRFIDREYRLRPPSLLPLLELLVARSSLNDSSFERPQLMHKTKGDIYPRIPELLAEYMRVYGLVARDAFELVDMLETSQAITSGHRLHIPLLVPLAIANMLKSESGMIPKAEKQSQWEYIVNYSDDVQIKVGLTDLAPQIMDSLGKGWEYYDNLRMQRGRIGYVDRLGAMDDQLSSAGFVISAPSNYSQLVQTVSRYREA